MVTKAEEQREEVANIISFRDTYVYGERLAHGLFERYIDVLRPKKFPSENLARCRENA